jgi:DNA (cytosine-5)-methyltransferase 1
MQIIDDLRGRRPEIILIENVPALISSKNGLDFRDALTALNLLGYSVDAFIIDAIRFVPQSRPRLFVVAIRDHITLVHQRGSTLRFYESETRPKALADFIFHNSDIAWNLRDFPTLPRSLVRLETVIDKEGCPSEPWWNPKRAEYLLNQMSERHRSVADRMIEAPEISYGTVFRRVRKKRSMAELRTDGIAGCLRTPKGGSGRQILFKAGKGKYSARLLSPQECARLMGADGYPIKVSLNQALFGFGDAVCVPVVEWIVRNYVENVLTELVPLGGRQERELCGVG